METRETALCLVLGTTAVGRIMRTPSWIDCVENVAPLEAVFGADLPTLQRVELIEIAIQRDGPKVTLRLDLADFPERPPSKWRTAGFNRVQLRLLATGLNELKVAGMHSKMVLDIEIERVAKGVQIHYATSNASLEILADALFVDGVSGYVCLNESD